MKSFKNSIGNEVKIFAETFEQEAWDQVKKLAEHPAYRQETIRIMPDAHAGKGCTVGTTMTIHSRVTPNLVGVDIGCGMLTVELDTDRIDCAKLDRVIRQHIPSGFSIHEKPVSRFPLSYLCCKDSVDLPRADLSLGTLGGGNHFIEVARSEKTGKHFLIIHTGSRKLGVEVCKYYQKEAEQCTIETANEEYERLFNNYMGTGFKFGDILSLRDDMEQLKSEKELYYVNGFNFYFYIKDMDTVQLYARMNRITIATTIIQNMGWFVADMFHTVHNYIDPKRMILRKGAVSAEKGERLLIPMNMRDGSLLCIGKGNPDWNYSAPHGAGRLMSRSRAKILIALSDFQQSMDGIYTTSVGRSTLDEAPQAYKPMEEISRAISDTVEVVDILKPIYNFKASEEQK